MIEKNIYRISLLAALIYIMFLQMCGGKKCPQQVVTKTTVDTVYVTHRDTIKSYIPKVTKVIEPVTIVRTDSLYVPQLIDTMDILKDYYSTRFYRDTAGTEVGDIIVSDSIRENRIVSRSWVTDFKIPEITKTVTVTEKKRVQLYAGFGLLGNYSKIGTEINFSMKTKSDQIYEIKGGTFASDWYVGAGTKFKLSFHK